MEDFLTNVSVYIGGFICFKLSKQIKCPGCIDLLFSKKNQEKEGRQLIESKLQYKAKMANPSAALSKMSVYLEEKVQQLLAIDAPFSLSNARNLKMDVLEEFENEPGWSHSDLMEHEKWLKELFSERYIRIRFLYISQQSTEALSQRQKLTKLIQFKGQ